MIAVVLPGNRRAGIRCPDHNECYHDLLQPAAAHTTVVGKRSSKLRAAVVHDPAVRSVNFTQDQRFRRP